MKRIRVVPRLSLAPAVTTALVAAALSFHGAGEAPAAPASPAPAQCDRFAAPGGRDANPGTSAKPFKTVQRLAERLRPGQTGCLRGGVYSDSSDGYALRFPRGGTPSAPIRIRGFRAERVAVLGIVMIPEDAPHVALSGLTLEGTGGQNSVKIYAEGVLVEDNDITNRGRGESCMMLGDGAVQTLVRRNRFFDCGRHGSNKDHAIYAAHADRAVIWGNIFWSHAGRAVQLYPDAQRNLVTHNVIDGGAPSIRGGIAVGSDEGYTSNGNVIEFNVIAYAETFNLYTNWNDDVGKGNVARNNCFWAGKDGNLDVEGGGLTHHSNAEQPPRFVSRQERDYRLKPSSKCRRVVGFDAAARLLPRP